MLKVANTLGQSGSILSYIGGTPLIRLERIAEGFPASKSIAKRSISIPEGPSRTGRR